MKKIVIILIPATAIAAVLFFTGQYPVALVGGSPIWFKTWKIAENAVKNSQNVEASSALLGGGVINFDDPQNASLLREVRRGTLSALIEDKILYQEGKEEVDNLEKLAEDRVNSALQGGNVGQAAQFVYGLTLEDFRGLVLLPQARREILREEFEKGGKNFNEWLSSAKKSKSVRLFLVPFVWDGESVK